MCSPNVTLLSRWISNYLHVFRSQFDLLLSFLPCILNIGASELTLVLKIVYRVFRLFSFSALVHRYRVQQIIVYGIVYRRLKNHELEMFVQVAETDSSSKRFLIPCSRCFSRRNVKIVSILSQILARSSERRVTFILNLEAN